MLESMASHLSNHPGAQPHHGFGQQPFQISTGVGQFMEDAFDPFSEAVQPTILSFWILRVLVRALGCPDLVVGPGINLRLPIGTDEALVANDLAAS